MIIDCISRVQALKELKESAIHHANDGREEALLRRDRDIIRALPSVTPQEPKWIPLIRREPTDEEKAEYLAQNGEELFYILENKMPLNGQEVLLSIGGNSSRRCF